ncbi:MAG: flagellar hook-associated protein FlgK [Terracidiphilus sp.]|nr:flagellar hook-associated protein FlgK [Terracidiphilus sp.]
MGTISSAFSLISQALDADQSALSIVANNVANASTTGYTKETPNFTENQSIEINGVSYGSGVTSTGSTSVRDRVLEERLNQQQQLASASGTRLTALDTLQALFTPASGTTSSTAGDIGTDITSFFSSFSSLEANPSNNALRQQVLSTATTLAGDISSAAASINSQKSALNQEATAVTTQVNALTTAIAQLNQQIETTSPNADAGTLEDQRQQDLSQLSKLIGINQVTTENNGLSITTTSGQSLVSDGSSFQLTTGTVDGVSHFFVGTTDVTSGLTSGGGELGGYLTARDQDIPSALASLDQLAYSVSTQVNTLNNAGTDLDGDTSNAGNIFSATTQVSGSAASMSVVMTDPNHIAAAASAEGTGGNTNATAMANLATQSIVNGQTPTDYYSNFVTTLGSTVSAVQTENTAQTASVTQLQTQRDALSSVSLNDEASSMQKFERSYQAASQVFSILNTIMASALNLGDQTTVS